MNRRLFLTAGLPCEQQEGRKLQFFLTFEEGRGYIRANSEDEG
jgi:hypothetical protein